MNKISIRQIKCLFTVFMAVCLWLSSATAYGQSVSVTVRMDNVPMSSVMGEIEKQTKYLFLYTEDVNTDRVVSVNAQARPLNEVLNQMLRGSGIAYEVTNSNIILYKEKPVSTAPVTVSGVVRDQDGEVLMGATVILKDTSVGTSTSADGSFTLQVPAPVETAVLSFEYLGAETVEMLVGSRVYFDVTLNESTVLFDDVVVTALGIRRSEKALSYNVQQVNAEEIVGVKDASFINALNGKVAGVNINSSSSGVGGATKVVMRGVKSIIQSSNAIYVIDGIPMYNSSRGSSTEFESTGTTDSAADINPEDIESISVLTGAAAAALYGSKAANGAILITTKKGAAGTTSVTVTQNTEFHRPFVKYEFQNRYGTSSDDNNMSWGNRLNSANSMGYNPYDDYFKTGVVTTETAAISTGNDKNQTYFSAGVINSNGIIPNNKYSRYNFNFRNTTSFLKDKMTLDLSANYIRQNDLNMTSQGVYSNPIVSAYLYPRGNDWENVKMFERWDPSRKIYTQEGWDMSPGEYVLQNPYWINYRNLNENKKDRYMFNAGLTYKVTDWLTLSGRVRVDNSVENSTKKNYASTNNQLTERSEYGLYGEGSLNSRQIYGDVMARFNKTFLCDDLSVDVTAGASIEDLRLDYKNVYGPIRDQGETALMSNVFNILMIDNSRLKRDVYANREQEQSVFATAELGYKSSYYLTGTFRTDWPSQLYGPESVVNHYNYYSVGLSVVFSEIFNMPQQISYLKLRSSYARVGNAFSQYLANPTFPWKNNQYSTSYSHYPVKDLKPEWTNSFEVGLSVRFFKNFNFDFTWYNTNTTDQLLDTGISVGSMYDTLYIQNGDIRNRGIEFKFGYDNRWKDFSWSSNFTLGMNRNKIMSLAENAVNYTTGEPISIPNIDMGKLGDTHFLLKEGGSMGDIYSSADLVRDSEGKIYVDQNGEVQTVRGINGVENWTYLGSIFPKANLGWRNDFSYKGINLGFLVTARLGGVVFSRSQATFDFYGVSEASAAARDNGGVRVNGSDLVDANNWYSQVAASDAIPQYYTYSATNVRLQEASIGYTIPRKWLKVCDITVSLVGRNLLMIYKKAPFDPESTATVGNDYYDGMDYFITPSTRNIGFSVRLKF